MSISVHVCEFKMEGSELERAVSEPERGPPYTAQFILLQIGSDLKINKVYIDPACAPRAY